MAKPQPALIGSKSFGKSKSKQRPIYGRKKSLLSTDFIQLVNDASYLPRRAEIKLLPPPPPLLPELPPAVPLPIFEFPPAPAF
jgi:hypothetical protein